MPTIPSVECGPFKLWAKGAVAVREATEEEWTKALAFAQEVETASSFWVADLIRYGHQRWGEKDPHAAAATGRSPKTLRTWVWVANAIDLSRRRRFEFLSSRRGRRAAAGGARALARRRGAGWAVGGRAARGDPAQRRGRSSTRPSTSSMTVVSGLEGPGGAHGAAAGGRVGRPRRTPSGSSCEHRKVGGSGRLVGQPSRPADAARALAGTKHRGIAASATRSARTHPSQSPGAPSALNVRRKWSARRTEVRAASTRCRGKT